jgi:thiol-disulfide isomerase/thioredoxin
MKVVSPDDASNLSNLLKDGDWMVLYYAEWCGHCKTMKPEWEKVVSKMKDTGKVNVAEVESGFIEHLKDKPQIEGYPTIKMYNSGKEVAKFGNEERIADNIEKFAMSNSNKKETNRKLVENKLEKLIEEKLDDKLEEMKPLTNLQNSHLSKKEIKHNSIEHQTIKEHSVKHSAKDNIKKIHPILNKHINNHRSKNTHKVSTIKKPVKDLQIDNLLTIPENNTPKKSATKPTTHQPQKNVSCNEIIKAKTCKSKPKCMYDYTDYKCKDKTALAQTIPKVKSHKSKSHKSKKSKKVSTKNVKNNLRTSTKEVFRELIKSFGRIGNEAKKDSKILRNATTKL